MIIFSQAAMKITVHGIVMSPPVRAVLLVCKALGVDYNFHLVNTIRGDHLTPEFLKVPPYPARQRLSTLRALRGQLYDTIDTI